MKMEMKSWYLMLILQTLKNKLRHQSRNIYSSILYILQPTVSKIR